MNYQKQLLLVLSSAGMVLTCFYAWTSFIFASLSQKPVSVAAAGGILFLVSLTTYIHHQRGWRRIYVFSLHGVGFIFSVLWLCHGYYELELSFWRLNWISELFMSQRVAAEWPILILILLCVWILWFCGVRMIAMPADKEKISHRFDLGLAFFLLLLLIKLIIAGKGATLPMEHSSVKAIISFIILGLFSMGLVRTYRASTGDGITYLKGAGIVMSFTAIILLLGGGLFILFLPTFPAVAKIGAGLLEVIKAPIGQLFIFLAMLSFKPGTAGEGVTGGFLPIINRQGGTLGALQSLYVVIAAIVLLVMAGFIFYGLLKWFFSRTGAVREKRSIWGRLLSCIHIVRRVLSILWTGIFYSSDTFSLPAKYYRHLLRWGRLSGLHHLDTETPVEYGLRLAERFPGIEKEIQHIIHMHDEAVYGSILPDGHQISHAKRALRRIRTPLLWGARIKSLCFDNRQLHLS